MKLPVPRQLDSGNWFVRVQVGGKRISVTEKTKQRCIDKAMLLKAQGRNGLLALHDPVNITLHDAMDNYLIVRSNVLSASTIAGYRDIQRLRFKSVMDSPIKNISSWQAVINAEAKLVAPKTLKNSWSFAHSALKEAGVPDKDIKVELPQIPKNERPFLDPDEIKSFLKIIKGTECELAAILALHGLRRSEVRDVMKSDVGKDVIHVRGACVRNEDNKFIHQKANKTEASRRDVPIMIPRLRKLVAEAPEGYLVTTYPSSTYRQINRLCKMNGLPEVGWHGLRHSFASLCYHLRIPELETARLGGWDDVNTVIKIYTHLAQKDKKSTEKKLKAFFNT